MEENQGFSLGIWRLPTVKMYDPLTDAWLPKANMPTARGASAGGTIHGRIYVIGGRNSTSSLATVEEYDPLSNKWTRRASMWTTNPTIPSRRWNFSASEVNGRIYAIGGAFEAAAPHPGVSLVLEYTPPVIPPVLQMKLVQSAGQGVLRLEWLSCTDCLDLLQTQDQFQPNGWTEVEKFSGTGETLTKDVPAVAPAAFYRVQRQLR